MKYILVVVLFAASAFAKDKPKDSDYQPATLVSFHTETRGAYCSSSADGTVDGSGNIHASGDSSCRDRTIRVYEIRVGNQSLSLEPALDARQQAAVLGSLGFARLVMKDSVLHDQVPGAAIEVRGDPSGLYVRVGKRESKFRVVAGN